MGRWRAGNGWGGWVMAFIMIGNVHVATRHIESVIQSRENRSRYGVTTSSGLTRWVECTSEAECSAQVDWIIRAVSQTEGNNA